MTPFETLAAIGGSSIVTLLVTKLLGKKKENADINLQWAEKREYDINFSDKLNKLVDEKARELTKELRETIADNAVKYKKDIQAQSETWAGKYVTLEEVYERKIKVLEMKIEVMERTFTRQIEALELSLKQEREECDRKMQELQDKIEKNKMN